MKRCHCRPGCLTWLEADDELTVTEHGVALVEHIDGVDMSEQLVLVGARSGMPA